MVIISNPNFDSDFRKVRGTERQRSGIFHSEIGKVVGKEKTALGLKVKASQFS